MGEDFGDRPDRSMLPHLDDMPRELLRSLIRAFKVFDHGETGKVPMEVLKLVLTTLGDKLTPEEMEEFVAEADVHGEGQVEYETFVRNVVFT